MLRSEPETGFRSTNWPSHRESALYTCLAGLALLACGAVSGVGPGATNVELTIVGDWRLGVTVRFDDGARTTGTVNIPPPGWLSVNAERYESLPIFEPRNGGWAKGARLRGMLAQECTTPFLLDRGSLVLRLIWNQRLALPMPGWQMWSMLSLLHRQAADQSPEKRVHSQMNLPTLKTSRVTRSRSKFH